MPVYKLTHMRAEVARLLFAYQGQEYVDKKVTMEEWPAVKPTTPFGQVPTLEIDGTVYTEFVAINNYLAREFGLYGRSHVEMLRVDEVVGKVQDMWTHIFKWYSEKDPQAKAALLKANVEKNFLPYLNALETILTKNGTGFYVGNQISYADIAVFDILDIEFPDTLLEKYPKVKACREMVRTHARLSKYIANRTDSGLP